MKRLFIIVITLFSLNGTCQHADTLTLETCYDSALASYPLIRQQALERKAYELQLKALNTNYFPSMNLNGQASYQSDVTSVIIDIPENPFFGAEDIIPPEVSNDWYHLNLDVNQVIYDGGLTRRQKELEETNFRSALQEIEIDLYGVKERVNEIYFSILLLQENVKIMYLMKENLDRRYEKVSSGVSNGVLMKMDRDVLGAEIIKTEQQIAELESAIKAGLAMLQELTTISFTSQPVLVLPDVAVDPEVFENNRPEYELMDIQQERLQKMNDLMTAGRIPMVQAFGQAGYGRPGYDMLSDRFEDYYKIGVRLAWNLWDWNKTKKEKEILTVKKDILDVTKETYDHNLNIALEKIRADIVKYQTLLVKDREIIKLRKSITQQAESQLDNGVITSTEYLIELNAEKEAILNRQKHEVMLVQTRIQYLTTLGNI